MFLAAGITAYGPAMFHLMTHAFFRLSLPRRRHRDPRARGRAGHAAHGRPAEALPRTYAVTLIGALALAGIPPLSGFWSKDAILASALAAGLYGQILWVVGLVGISSPRSTRSG